MLQDTNLSSSNDADLGMHTPLAVDGDETSPTAINSVASRSSITESSRFTSTENPFLYPRDLLDVWTASLEWSPEYEFLSSPDQLDDLSSYSIGDFDKGSSKWWLAHTKPRQEKKLAKQLCELQVPHYLPVTKCKAVTRRRTRVTLQPQFPGYLFLCVNADQRRSVLETNRVVATHSVDDQHGLRKQLWTLADLIEKGVPLRLEERLGPGNLVRVKSGLLRDITGTVIKRGGKTRLFVSVSELLGGVSLEIEQHLLEPY